MKGIRPGPDTLHAMRSSGLGLLEYLEFFEDTGMEPIMAVWAGEYSVRDGSTQGRALTPHTGYALGGTSVAENALPPFIQQAADQVSFFPRSADEALLSSDTATRFSRLTLSSGTLQRALLVSGVCAPFELPPDQRRPCSGAPRFPGPPRALLTPLRGSRQRGTAIVDSAALSKGFDVALFT